VWVKKPTKRFLPSSRFLTNQTLHYEIHHTTIYTYSSPVLLSPHTLKLRPRCDVTQQVRSFALSIDPQPSRLCETLDLDGNNLLQVWFPETAVTSLTVQATAEVTTLRGNPFNFLLEPWATRLPIDYPASLLSQLQPYLSGYFGTLDPQAIALAQEILQATDDPITWLSELNQRIYTTCRYTLRETGEPFSPGLTWQQQNGSCRDFAVLFMETCRAIGLATRFVSGYQEGEADRDNHDLHAWAEVYLPGGGWRGYDPTQGLAVGDRYIAVYASASARQTAPIWGTLQTKGAQSQMEYKLKVRAIE